MSTLDFIHQQVYEKRRWTLIPREKHIVEFCTSSDFTECNQYQADSDKKQPCRISLKQSRLNQRSARRVTPQERGNLRRPVIRQEYPLPKVTPATSGENISKSSFTELADCFFKPSDFPVRARILIIFCGLLSIFDLPRSPFFHHFFHQPDQQYYRYTHHRSTEEKSTVTDTLDNSS